MLQIELTQDALERVRRMMARGTQDEVAYIVKYKGKP